MLGENRWKVLVLVAGLFLAQAIDSPSRNHRRIPTSLSRYPLVPYGGTPMFVPRSRPYRKRQSRVLLFDDEEPNKQYGKGEIDLTQDYTKVKFDETTDFDFTSPEAEVQDAKTEDFETKEAETPSGNERYFDAPRIRPTPFAHSLAAPKYYQGRFNRPYAPNFFDPYFPVNPGPFSPSVRNGFYGSPAGGGWKARSPRVVFPYTQDTGANSLTFQSNSHQGGTGGALASGINFNNDNVVFRDQNFGLNEVSSSDDLALQDLGTGSAAPTGADSFADRDRAASRSLQMKRNNRMDYPFEHIRQMPNYIPIMNYYSTNRPLILSDSTKILPPNTVNHSYTNITKMIGNNVAMLPKFKPISDDEIIRIEQLFENQPITTTKEYIVPTNVPYTSSKVKKYRKGKMLVINSEEVAESNHLEIATEVTMITTKGVERQDEKKCPQGGTCEFFIYCWMVGGQLEGTCGLLKGCCHKVAKAGILGVQDSNTLDYSAASEGALTNYGPVINDQSKSQEMLE